MMMVFAIFLFTLYSPLFALQLENLLFFSLSLSMLPFVLVIARFTSDELLPLSLLFVHANQPTPI